MNNEKTRKMSVRNQQSDTSRVVKNSLLSAVPHSIDDFVHNTILLPAAEIPAPIVAEARDIDENNGKLPFPFQFINLQLFSSFVY